jgi:cell wall-associated NlpC family hydrolase
MQREYENQQADLERQLTDKKATSSDYEAQIANAESQAAELVSLINKQNAEIRQIEEEEKKAAEEAARKAAEEAAKKAAAEEAAKKAAAEEAEKQQTANSNKPSASTGNGSSQKPQSGNQSGNTNTNNNNSNNNTNNNNNQGNDTQKEDNSSKDESAGSNVPYNPTGAAVVNYACQFVGNPYVYGGNSLTNGTDCSGFIKLVYGHFGVSLPRSSGAMQSVGRAVPYSQAMPGDIICYSGHVALYMGGGQIVHASNSAPYPKGGIKISPNAAYQTILTVRRVL